MTDPDYDYAGASSCPSCHVPYIDHLGLNGTCAKLLAMTAERDKALATAQSEPERHEWGADERCVKCGNKDWMGGPCTPKQTVANKTIRETIDAVNEPWSDEIVEAMYQAMRSVGAVYGDAPQTCRNGLYAILAAIRAGKVPGVYACKSDAEMGRYHVAYCEQMKQERDKALADLAACSAELEAERGQSGYISGPTTLTLQGDLSQAKTDVEMWKGNHKDMKRQRDEQKKRGDDLAIAVQEYGRQRDKALADLVTKDQAHHEARKKWAADIVALCSEIDADSPAECIREVQRMRRDLERLEDERNEALADLTLASEACAEKQAIIEQFMEDERKLTAELRYAKADAESAKMDRNKISNQWDEMCKARSIDYLRKLEAMTNAAVAQRDELAALLREAWMLGDDMSAALGLDECAAPWDDSLRPRITAALIKLTPTAPTTNKETI